MTCRACETVAHCTANGCIPLKREDAPAIPATRLHRMASSEFYDEPVATPEQAMTWPSLALTFALGAAVAGVVIALLTMNWPLFVWAAGVAP